ncbi:hypothetical protein [Streptomyces sp. NRRL F-5053]|uniref:hypothetical protein n=1 Tax=Streptomyces sp. NRRL F-5053 TaxID=1463854 RepID=UPI0004C719EA|nr:hypothetical protein [Streptomyces sp. NRRL F-5053]
MYDVMIPGPYARLLRRWVITQEVHLSESLSLALSQGVMRFQGPGRDVLQVVLGIREVERLHALSVGMSDPVTHPVPTALSTPERQAVERVVARTAALVTGHEVNGRDVCPDRVAARRARIRRAMPARQYRKPVTDILQQCPHAAHDQELVTGETVSVQVEDLWRLVWRSADADVDPYSARVAHFVHQVIDHGTGDLLRLWPGGPHTADVLAMLVEPPVQGGSRPLLLAGTAA